MPAVIQSDKLASSHLGAAAVFGLQVPAYLEGVYAGAYSLRLLRQTYTGPLLKVRNATNNAEATVAPVGFALRTSSVVTVTAAGTSGYSIGQTMTLATFAGAANVAVVTWYDQSGNGRDLTQGTAAAQPSLMVAGAFNTLGGLPIIVCDGVDDNLRLTYTRPAAHSLLWAGRTGASTTATVLSGLRVGGANWAHEINAALGGGRHINNGTGLVDPAAITDYSATRVYAAKFNSTTSAFYVDGAQVVTGDAGNYGSLDLRLGISASGGFFATQYREVLMWPDVTPDLAAVSQKVMGYYGM